MYDGFIKVRLGHSNWGSVIVPDQLVIKLGGWRFFQPSFFGPCLIGFNIEPDIHQAIFSMDVGRPRDNEPRRIIITLRSDSLVRSNADGSQIYACQIEGPTNLTRFSAGKCHMLAEGEFSLQLYHHTTPTNYPLIRASNELWTSAWNLAGVRELANVAYAYLTSLPKIENDNDLNRIAMASDGRLHFQTTSLRHIENTLSIDVYRDNTKGRTAALCFGVPWTIISPPHLFIHQPMIEQAYYEVVGPEIYRVGMMPGCKLRIANDMLNADDARRKNFQHIVLGETNSLNGLGAPYDEEGTSMIMRLQQFKAGETLFDFWQANANSDQMIGGLLDQTKFKI